MRSWKAYLKPWIRPAFTQKYNKTNFLLMHAMGPNVAGVIGSAIAAGFLLSVFGG